jgi:hypothetical protein
VDAVACVGSVAAVCPGSRSTGTWEPAAGVIRSGPSVRALTVGGGADRCKRTGLRREYAAARTPSAVRVPWHRDGRNPLPLALHAPDHLHLLGRDMEQAPRLRPAPSLARGEGDCLSAARTRRAPRSRGCVPPDASYYHRSPNWSNGGVIGVLSPCTVSLPS